MEGSGLEALHPGTLDCVHCGLCLSSCPTYRVTGRETSSPRGRVYLMRGVAEGEIPLSGTLADEAYLCLGCRACETACPSGVAFGSLLEQTRAAVDDAGLRRGWAKWIERLALRQVVPRQRVLHGLMGGLSLVQRLGLDRLLLPLLPRRLREMHGLLPRVPAAADRRRLPRVTPARGEKRGRVAFFEGCVMPEMFGAVNRATVEVLAGQGFEVVVPADQGCCGALQAHGGELEFASELARANVVAFRQAGEIDAVILNSAGCGAAIRELDHWLGEEGALLAGQVRDVCEFLDQVGLRGTPRSLAKRVAYDDPCHLVHGQGVASAPRRLLEAIPELKLVAHDDPASCCGAAGIYNLTHPEMSAAVLASKLDALEAARPEIIATGNPGCLMQLEAGARGRGLDVRLAHPIELLAEALC
ncbi:MAG: (Fe-S)-binding protein [Deltaproteobacteria bacterium]|nr:(Fe-S)-binding protein [Deltaproteobacteria bacterium]